MGLTVFISSTVTDLQYVREDLCWWLRNELHHTPWAFEDPDWPNRSGAAMLDECLINAKEADCFVLVLDREIGRLCKEREAYFTELEWKERRNAGWRNAFVFVERSTWTQWEVYRDAPPEDKETLLSTNPKLQPKAELLRFISRVFDPSHEPRAIQYSGIPELKQHLGSQLRRLEPVQASQADGRTTPAEPSPTASAPAVSPVECTAEAPIGPPARHALDAARRARVLGGAFPKGIAARACGVLLVRAGGAPAFWVLQSISSTDWLGVLTPHIGSIATGDDETLRLALANMLSRLARSAPDDVMASSLVRALWESDSPSGRLRAMTVIAAANAWATPLSRELLDTVPGDDTETVGYAARSLNKALAQHPDAIAWTLDWTIRQIGLVPRASRGRGTGPSHALDGLLHSVTQQRPDLALGHVEEVINAHLSSAEERELVMELLRPIPVPGSAGSPTVQMVKLLRDSVTDEPTAEQALALLLDFVRSDSAVKRVVALDVAKEALLPCQEVIILAASDPENHTWPHADWTDYLVSQVAPLLNADEAERLTQGLLGLPDAWPDEQSAGIVKYYALSAIPDAQATPALKEAMERLLTANPQLQPRASEPDRPGRPMVFHDIERSSSCPDFPSLVRTPDVLAETLQHLDLHDAHDVWFDFARPLGDALVREPDTVLGVARAIAGVADTVDQQFADAVAWAVRENEGINGQTAFEVAQALEPAASTTTRTALSAAIAKRWPAVSEEVRPAAVALLCGWAKPRCRARPDQRRTRPARRGRGQPGPQHRSWQHRCQSCGLAAPNRRNSRVSGSDRHSGIGRRHVASGACGAADMARQPGGAS